MTSFIHRRSRFASGGFTLSEMAISVAITVVATVLVLTVSMTVIRGALQNQRELETHYRLQSSLQRIEMILQTSKIPPVIEGDSAFIIFKDEFSARAANSANAGARMIQVNNFKKKGINPNQKSINIDEIKKPIQKAADLMETSSTANVQVYPGDVVHFDTTPSFSRVVKSVNHPEAAVRTIVFEESLPVSVPSGTKIQVGSISRLMIIDGELRLYPDSGQKNYDVLCHRLDVGQSTISSEGGDMMVILQTTIPTYRGEKILRLEKKISLSSAPLFYSDFNTSSQGGAP